MSGLVRWFQRLSSVSSSSTSSSAVDDHDHDDYHSQNDAVQTQISSENESQKELTITVDLDISGLKPIKVPDRTAHKLAPTDPNKVSHTHNPLSLFLFIVLDKMIKARIFRERLNIIWYIRFASAVFTGPTFLVEKLKFV